MILKTKKEIANIWHMIVNFYISRIQRSIAICACQPIITVLFQCNSTSNRAMQCLFSPLSLLEVFSGNNGSVRGWEKVSCRRGGGGWDLFLAAYRCTSGKGADHITGVAWGDSCVARGLAGGNTPYLH